MRLCACLFCVFTLDVFGFCCWCCNLVLLEISSFLKGGDSVRKLRISLFSITFGRTCSSLTVRQYRKGVTEIEVQIIKYSLSFKIVHHLYFLIVSYNNYYFVLSIDIDRLHLHKLFIHCFGTDNIYPFDPRFVHTN